MSVIFRHCPAFSRLIVGLLAVLVMVSPVMSGEPKLSQSEVVSIANDAAKASGYKLTDFRKPKARYEFVRKDSTWSVFYEGKKPWPGNHFLVIVEDITKHTTVHPGE